MSTKKALFFVLAAFLLLAFVVSGCETDPEEAEEVDEVEEKEEIVIGASRSMSGPLAVQQEMAFGPVYQMWVDEVNERGGIYVEEYDKKLPIDLIEYDDTSDMGTMTRMLERLMVEDEVDLLLAPISTAFLNTAAPLANENEYLLMGAEGGAKELEPLMEDLPYFFSVLSYSVHQMPALIDMLEEEEDIEDAAIFHIADQHGIDYASAANEGLEEIGVDVLVETSFSPGTDDVSHLIEDAEANDVDAVFFFGYPDENFLFIEQAMGMDYNPDLMLFGPGMCFEAFRNMFGDEVVEGVMGWGTWNEKISEEAADFAERLTEHQDGERNLDWWGDLPYYASLQILEQAIEEAGTLDNSELKDVIAEERFDTVMGEVWFEDGRIPAEAYPAHVGQWQDGVFELVAPTDSQTAEPVIPKPEWPEQ